MHDNKPFDSERYEEIKKKGTAIRVLINGNEFNSIAEACRYFKVSGWTVYKRCASHEFPDWQLLG